MRELSNENNGVLLIGVTNDPKSCSEADLALFKEHLFMHMPTLEDRTTMFRHILGRGESEDFVNNFAR